jgi:CubicO group peptidase (beta-lactamase class C family)
MRIRSKIIIVCFLVISAARAQEIDKSQLENLLIQAQETNSEAVIVYKNNQLVTEKYFGFGHADKKTESMSCTKSIVGLAMACVLSDKLIDSLDIPVSYYYPEWRQGQKQFITIRHLMNMTSGIQNHPNASVEIYPSPDFVQLALAAELSHKPGEIWSYNNKSLNLMAGVIQKITGKRMDVYIGERLFKPLGISDFTWTLDESGNPHVMSGCQIKPIDFAKIGLLLINNGEFNQEKIIAEEHLIEVITPSKQFEKYGMLWWIDYEKSASHY